VSAAGLKGNTPYETLFQQPVDPSYFHPFGCIAYTLIPKDKHPIKHSPKSVKCIILGYTAGQKAYKLLDVASHKVFSSCYVIFNEGGTLPPEFSDAPLNSHASSKQWEDMLDKLFSKQWESTKPTHPRNNQTSDMSRMTQT
jgi:hypothetical protein